MPASPRPLPPIWMMGMTNATWGLMGGFAVVTLPQMLAARGVSGGVIAALTATLLWPGVLVAFVSPLLDVRFSRRTYAIATALLTAAAVAFTVLHLDHTRATITVMIAGYTAAALYQGAVGGWMGSLIGHEGDAPLGIWFAVANTGSGGVMMFLGASLLTWFGPRVAALCLAGLLLLPPLLLFPFLPAPGPDRKLASESFSSFWTDIAALMQRRDVVWALLLFILPCASFSLTNVLGGVGRDFHASEHLVSIAAGIGSVLAGVVGSFAVAPLARRFALRPAYLGIGVAGGLFTLSLLALPRSPAVFGIAITGENLFQAMSFAAANAIIFESVGPGNPLAATLFTVLIGVSNLPIVYMGYLDAAGYRWHGIAGSFAMDAGLSIAVCAVLACVVWRRSTRSRLQSLV